MSQVQPKLHLLSPQRLNIEWTDGRSSQYQALWLRLHCIEDRDAYSGQRLRDIAELPGDPQIAVAEAVDDELEITWADDGLKTRFGFDWLRANRPDAPAINPLPALPWSGLSTSHFCWMDYGTFVSSRDARVLWMSSLTAKGIAFLCDVPEKPGMVLELAPKIGFVYETNYGRLYDVRAMLQPENMAYTDEALALHTDNPYRDPVPGYQMLHCLESGDQGGESLFADGFAVAAALRADDLASFEALSQLPVEFTFRSKDAELRAVRPLIQLGAGGNVEAVHYNHRSLGTIRMPDARLVDFTRAYRKFSRLMNDPTRQLRLMLKPGELVAFDNRRLLHGRTAVTSITQTRHLQGCYLTRDSVRSNFLVLSRKRARGSL